MKYKNVIVTGGAGFIGSHLVHRLLTLGCKVTVIDDLSEGKWENLPKHKNLIKKEASILDDLSKELKKCDVVFHLAAIPRMQRSVAEPWETHRANVDGTLNLLLLAKKYNIKKFVMASSSSIYGNQSKTPFNEKMTPDPLVPYSLQKLVGEQYCLMFAKLWGVPTICLRYFNVYGPGMNPNGSYANLIPKFINLIRDDKTPTINGSGLQTRDFTYVDDIVDANILAANSKVTGEVINIGTGTNISVREIVKILNSLLGKNIKPNYGPVVPEPKNTKADNKKAKKLLGWKPKINFTDGIKMVISNT